MPSLRNQRLSRKCLLAAALTLSLLAGVDAFRPPQHQISVRLFSLSVDAYHRFVHPLTGRVIRCRYQPTCSSYGLQAVQRYGIARGAYLTVRRIYRCRPSVPKGTRDPVPNRGEGIQSGWNSLRPEPEQAKGRYR